MTTEQVSMSSFWGVREVAYTSAIVQTLVLSPPFRRHFIGKIIQQGRDHGCDTLDLLERLNERVEVEVTGRREVVIKNSDRIDLFLNFGEEYLLGLENKKWAGLQSRQLKRYDEGLTERELPFLLVFLSPSTYTLRNEDRPKLLTQFLHIRYKDILAWVDDYLARHDPGPFEKAYFQAFHEYLGEVEMKPLSVEELDALKNYSLTESSLRKLRDIVVAVQENLTEDSGIEDYKSHKFILGYYLTNSNIHIYFGFRYGKGSYLDKVELIEPNEPEAIVYVKDIEKDGKIAERTNKSLMEIEKKENGTFKNLKSGGGKPVYFDRQGVDECRFAVRKSLRSFPDLKPETLSGWLEEVVHALEVAFSRNS